MGYSQTLTAPAAQLATDPRQLGLPPAYLPTDTRIRHLVEECAESAGLDVEALSQREGEQLLAELRQQDAVKRSRPRQLELMRPARVNHRWNDNGYCCERCKVFREPIFEREINGKRLVVYQYCKLGLGEQWTRKRPDCVSRKQKGGAHVRSP